MNCKAGYRVGHPRITETMAQHDGGRETGYLGTGVYFYSSKERMEQDKAYSSGQESGYTMPCACRNPLMIPEGKDRWGTSIAMSFHEGSKHMVRKALNDPEGMFLPSYLFPAIKECQGDEGNMRCMTLWDQAVRRTKECIKKAGTPHAATCNLPINYVLDQLGYDCVVPAELANHKNYGTVVLKEALDKCAGPVDPYKDIPLDQLSKCVGTVVVSKKESK